MKAKILRTVRQPSTWAGIGLLGSLFGVRELSALAAPEIGVGIAALLAIFLDEKPAEK